MSLMTSLIVCLSLVAGAASLDDGALELRYNGSLDKATRDGEGSPAKRFSLFFLLSKPENGRRELAWTLDERGGGGWAWPERYGMSELDPQLVPANKTPQRLLYDHQGTPTVIPLPAPLFAAWDKLKAGATWNEGKEAWEVKQSTKFMDRKCWEVHSTTGFGRRKTFWVDEQVPVVLGLEERVFIGQGEEYTLKLQLSGQKTLSAEEATKFSLPLKSLLALQAAVARPENEHRAELSEVQLKAVVAALPELTAQATDTPWSALVTSISRDTKAQNQRFDEVGRLARKYIGQAAPDFAATTLDKKAVESKLLKDKILVLHFWEYQNEPLVEPYGQTGYLDHLYSRRRKLGVEVMGVAVDNKLADPTSKATATRSVQKFKEFMNLSYPIIIDDGSLAAKFGDPRRAGAHLPLWVIVGADGKILHYSVGFFKVNPDEGLRELDDLLVKTIRDARAAQSEKKPE